MSDKDINTSHFFLVVHLRKTSNKSRRVQVFGEGCVWGLADRI